MASLPAPDRRTSEATLAVASEPPLSSPASSKNEHIEAHLGCRGWQLSQGSWHMTTGEALRVPTVHHGFAPGKAFRPAALMLSAAGHGEHVDMLKRAGGRGK